MEKKLLDEQDLIETLNQDYLAEWAERGEEKGLRIWSLEKIEERDGTNWKIDRVNGKVGSAEKRLVEKVYQEARKKYNLK